MASLGVADPDIKPKATEHIEDMIENVRKLVERGIAYEVDGDVFYSVRKFPGYGKLSRKNIEELESGARVGVDERKRDPLDFALWKAAKPGEPEWDSPWGKGRPGWHIECSAMSSKYLGQPFDIHGGGRDLIFPHHENEIAQAEGARGCQFVRYWLHNGFININAEKMSKSLGNITAIREVLKRHDFEAVRLFLLSNHYRSPIDYTEKAMAEAEASLDRFYDTAGRALKCAGAGAGPDGGEELKKAFEEFEGGFDSAMDDDFNTAMAVGTVFELVRLTNKFLDAAGEGAPAWVAEGFKGIQRVAGEVLGIFGSEPAAYRDRTHARVQAKSGVDTAEVERLIAERADARKSKDFARADAIRDELAEMGVEFKDKPDGTTEWRLR